METFLLHIQGDKTLRSPENFFKHLFLLNFCLKSLCSFCLKYFVCRFFCKNLYYIQQLIYYFRLLKLKNVSQKSKD